jgi:hypothetical protein
VAEIDRLGGFFGRALYAGLVSCDDQVAEQIEMMWHRQLAACVVAEALAVRVAAALDDAGVDWRLTKGPALAHLDYRDPSLRTFGDIDIVVRARHWETACGALATVGLGRDVPELRRGYDVRFGKGATMVDGRGSELDVHLRFAIGRFGLLAHMDDVFGGSQPLVLGGRVVPALAPGQRLLHACYHAALGGFRHLRALRDVAQLVLVTDVPWYPLLPQVRAWHAEPVVASAVRDCWTTFALDPQHELYQWALGVQPSRRDAHALAVFQAERPFRAQVQTSFSALPPTQWPRLAWALSGPAFSIDGQPRSLAARVRGAMRGRWHRHR